MFGKCLDVAMLKYEQELMANRNNEFLSGSPGPRIQCRVWGEVSHRSLEWPSNRDLETLETGNTNGSVVRGVW